jgi:uncharacterized protein
MSRTDVLDLARMRLTPGEGRRLDLEVALADMDFSGERYAVAEPRVPVRLDVSRMNGGGYSLRQRFEAGLRGPCMRCLRDARVGGVEISVDAREIDQPGGGDELSSPYVSDEELDLAGWARDAYALALPAQVVCREDCAGLCPVCGADLADAGPDHAHESEPDPRWAKLRELRFE